ncbi:MAG: NUDIX hydrolase [Pseudonocardiaceae bacterium]
MPDQPTIVAAIVTSPQGVLLARRHDGKPAWTFPSGAQEAGEVYADRETREETGLAVIVRDLIGERTHPKTGRHMEGYSAGPVEVQADYG